MTLKHIDEYRDPVVSRKMINEIQTKSRSAVRLMEVCGTHTMSIFRNGIRSVLPDTVTLLSGPGCPVCVTSQSEIDAFIALTEIDNAIIATFGDLIRVPGTTASLQSARSEGRDIRIVYSASDAVEIAEKNPDKNVIFIGIGFETTAPTIAASILTAKQKQLKNFFIYSVHKTTPPALNALLQRQETRISGFMLPGHVCTITGAKAFLPIVEKYHIPAVVAGFEPADILRALLMLVNQIENHSASLENAYERAVAFNGNTRARVILNQVFEPSDAIWRGIGRIPASGLKLRKAYHTFDAEKVFRIPVRETAPPSGCLCGEILMGLKTPVDCTLYKKVCTPLKPVGPCMVSSEGTCAAYYRYQDAS